jgi:hypothetical protein
MECAKSVLEFARGDELQLRKIWLQIAKHVVREKNDIKTAMLFLQVRGWFCGESLFS